MGGAEAGRRRAVVRLRGEQPAQPRRARRAAGSCARAVPPRATAEPAPNARAADRARRDPAASVALHFVQHGARAAHASAVLDRQRLNPMSDPLPFLPFALPDIGDDEIAEVVDTLKSGWITTGPKAKRFEDDFTTFLGDPGLQSIAVNSATAGLHLALESLGIGPGDEVITTTHTFTATAEVVRYLGADVKLVDIAPATLCIDPAAVEAAITPRTRALMPVHYAGLSADMPALLALAKKHGLKVVEDAAHALPTTCGGKLIGTLDSDATVFSFYANKTITTGEGGMVVTRDAELAKRMK